MATRSGIRRLILITGTLLCVLIAAAFVVSAWWMLVLQVPTPYGPMVQVVGGSVTVLLDDLRGTLVQIRPNKLNLYYWNAWWAGEHHVALPLYAVFLAVAIPTLLVWRFCPKPIKPGHCRCGYDLTGNTSGVCPECGQPFDSKGDAT